MNEITFGSQKWRDISNTLYINGSFMKILLGYEKDGAFLVKHAFSCRDDVLSEIRKHVKTKGFENAERLSKMRFGLIGYFSTNMFETRLKFAEEVLNGVERQLKWKRTKITMMDSINIFTKTGKTRKVKIGKAVKKNSDNYNVSVALLEGSKCWVQNPFFIHIILGTIKQSFYKYVSLKKYKAKTLEDVLNLISGTGSVVPASGGGYEYANLWIPLLKNRRKIFGTFRKSDLFKSRGSYVASYGLGVNALLCDVDNLNRIYDKDGRNLGQFVSKWKRSLKR